MLIITICILNKKSLLNKVWNNFNANPAESQKTQNIFITFARRRPNVFDVGPTLYKSLLFTGITIVVGPWSEWNQRDTYAFPCSHVWYLVSRIMQTR